jgi:hypothetical protein
MLPLNKPSVMRATAISTSGSTTTNVPATVFSTRSNSTCGALNAHRNSSHAHIAPSMLRNSTRLRPIRSESTPSQVEPSSCALQNSAPSEPSTTALPPSAMTSGAMNGITMLKPRLERNATA